jgi:predicted phosphodiesterase
MALKKKLDNEPTQALSTNAKREALGRIADLLDRNGINIDEIGIVKRVSLYQSLTKNEEGEAEVHDLVGVQLSPQWADGPAWPVITQGPSIKLSPVKATGKKKAGEWKTAVVLPDMQIGYFRLADDSLEPTHDEVALEVALAITKDAQPDVLVLVGDNLDFPEFGKYLTTAPYQRTTQAALDRATLLCAQLRAAAPNAKIVWIAGNHEERLPRSIATNAAAAFGLRRGNLPESWPVMSVPFLCRFDDYDVEFLAGYPASMYWINERLRVIHGDRVNSNGVTASKFLAREKVSVIYGHIHRREWAEMTREDHDGPRTILAASAGCLARIDGAVPSVKGGVDLDGRPIVRHEDWQQGIAIVDYKDGDGDFNLELVPIRQGTARWRGTDYACGND